MSLGLCKVVYLVLVCTVIGLSILFIPIKKTKSSIARIESYTQIIQEELSAFPDNPLAFYLFNADKENTILRFRIDGGKVAAESVGEQIKDGGYFILRNEEDIRRLNFVCINGRGKVTAVFYPKRVEIK